MNIFTCYNKQNSRSRRTKLSKFLAEQICLKAKLFNLRRLKKTFQNPQARIFLGVFIFLMFFYSTFQAFRSETLTENISAVYIKNDYEPVVLGISTETSNNEVYLTPPNKEEADQALIAYKEKIKRIKEQKRKEEERKRQERLNKISALEAFLNRMNSPMAPHADIIYDTCIKQGSHYCKYYLSIAGVESGFGRISIGCCNAHGLVGINYSNWEDSIKSSSNLISKYYYLKGYDTFETLAYSAYGPHEPEKWIENLYYFYNMMNFLD